MFAHWKKNRSERVRKSRSLTSLILCLCILLGFVFSACGSASSVPSSPAADPSAVPETPPSPLTDDPAVPDAGDPAPAEEPSGEKTEAPSPAEAETGGEQAEPETPVPEDAAPAERKARRVDFSVKVNNISTTAPTDDNPYSVQKFERSARMRLFLDEPVSSLYFIWNDFPGKFFITVDGTRYEYDGSRYLHQFVELPQASADILIAMPNRRTQLCDLYAFTEGAPPDWVQVWESLGEDETADMLLFPTHSDDEFLFFGGVIPLYAGEQGKKLQVVYMNIYMEDYVIRTHELLNGLWSAGCRIYPVINDQVDVLFDSVEEAAAYYGYDNFVSFQVEMIRRFKPKVIVEHDFDGEYGHPTHIFNAYCLADAVNMAGSAEYYPESAEQYGVWDTPKTYFHLYPENPIVLDFETPLAHFDGATAADIAARAYGYYYSQHPYYWGVFFSGPYDCHKWGLYRSTVGLDEAGGDMFENIPEN